MQRTIGQYLRRFAGIAPVEAIPRTDYLRCDHAGCGAKRRSDGDDRDDGPLAVQVATVFRESTAFGEVRIVDSGQERQLFLGGSTIQSAMWLPDPARLVLAYTRAMASALLFVPEPRQVAAIGLGGGSLVRFVRRYFPAAKVHAVDISAAVVAAATRYFLVEPDDHTHLYCQDGHTFIRDDDQGSHRFDVIWVDAFTNRGPADFLTQPDFYGACQERLAEQGVAAFNLWSRDQKQLHRVHEFINRAFSRYVLRLAVPDRGNIILLATNSAGLFSRLERYRDRAKQLESITGMDYLRQWHWLQKGNKKPWWSILSARFRSS